VPTALSTSPSSLHHPRLQCIS